MSDTKAQLIEELKEVKARNIALTVNNEQMMKTNAELGCRIGQLESDMAELEAFKQDALKSLDKLSKERDFLNEELHKKLKVIEDRDNEIRVLKTTITRDVNTILRQGGMLQDKDALITGSLIRLLRERWERRSNR